MRTAGRVFKQKNADAACKRLAGLAGRGLVPLVMAACLAGSPATAREVLRCPPVSPNEPKTLMTCPDLAATSALGAGFAAVFSTYAARECASSPPPAFVPVPHRAFCEGKNRILRALDQAEARGQPSPVPADWEEKLGQLIEKTKANNARYEAQGREQQKLRAAVIGPRKNDVEAFDRLLKVWKDNVNVGERKFAALASWWGALPATAHIDGNKVALTTCLDWLWLGQKVTSRPALKRPAMLLEPLFEQCYANPNAVAVIPLEKVEGVLAEFQQSGELPAAEAKQWSDGILRASRDNFALLGKVAEARNAQLQEEKEAARIKALTPEQRAAELAQRRAAQEKVHGRNCAAYKSAYELSYRNGDAKGAAAALGAMDQMGCL